MAFLVRSAVDATAPSPSKEMYLRQPFYECIFERCLGRREYTVLAEIAALRYKSPTMHLAGSRLESLERDLELLRSETGGLPQLSEFLEVSAKTRSTGRVLFVSGDMYLEL